MPEDEIIVAPAIPVEQLEVRLPEQLLPDFSVGSVPVQLAATYGKEYLGSEYQVDAEDNVKEHYLSLGGLIPSKFLRASAASVIGATAVDTVGRLQSSGLYKISVPQALIDLFANQPKPFPQSAVTSKAEITIRKYRDVTSCIYVSGVYSGSPSVSSKIAVATLANTSVSTSSKVAVATGIPRIMSFRWATDAVTPVWSAVDTTATISAATTRILAVRVKNTGTAAFNINNTALQEGTGFFPVYSSLAWSNISGASWGFIAPSFYAAKTDGSTVNTYEFVCNPGGGTLVSGKFETNGTMPSLTLNPGQETEIWFSIFAPPDATNSAFRFTGTVGSVAYGGNFQESYVWATVV